jgi:hypothetical protein
MTAVYAGKRKNIWESAASDGVRAHERTPDKFVRETTHRVAMRTSERREGRGLVLFMDDLGGTMRARCVQFRETFG